MFGDVLHVTVMDVLFGYYIHDTLALNTYCSIHWVLSQVFCAQCMCTAWVNAYNFAQETYRIYNTRIPWHHQFTRKRTHTITITQGGETYFTKLDLPLKVKSGDAIVFWNLKRDGSVDPDTYHSALPPRSGEKWVAVKWIHERRYQKVPESESGSAESQAGRPMLHKKVNDLLRKPVAVAS